MGESIPLQLHREYRESEWKYSLPRNRNLYNFIKSKNGVGDRVSQRGFKIMQTRQISSSFSWLLLLRVNFHFSAAFVPFPLHPFLCTSNVVSLNFLLKCRKQLSLSTMLLSNFCYIFLLCFNNSCWCLITQAHKLQNHEHTKDD